MRAGIETSSDGARVDPEASRLRRTYLIALTYPLWHLAAPEGARDPWWVWWAVASTFLALAVASRWSAWVERRLPDLFPVCSYGVAAHFYSLAALNGMHPFYVVGSAMAVLSTVIFIRSRPGLLAYGTFLTLLSAALYAVEPTGTKLAYWGGTLTILPLAYLKLELQLRREAGAQRMHVELEARVAERTIEVEAANERLRREIREKERLEGQLRFSHKMEVLGQVAGGMAHDFNNLLSTVGVYAELVLEGLEPESPLRKDVKQIQKTTRQASALTQQLLDLSRRGLGEPRVLDLNQAVVDSLSVGRHLLSEDVVLELKLSERPAWVRADPNQIQRVLMNLILNARDAMPRGGRLVLATSILASHELPEALSTRAGPGGHVRLAVADTGVGMDEATLSQAFEPFFTSKPQGQGTGLGLSIVYGIVEQSDGWVDVTSSPGAGARFEIYWPMQAAAAEPVAPSTRVETGSERILLVEDDDDLRHALERVLRGGGYRVVEAADGSEALGLVERSGEAFDLVVSDVVMPNVSGFELAERLRAERPDTKVLLVSGQLSHPSLRDRTLPPGVAFLPKPFTPRDLAGKIRSVLRSGGA